MTQASDRLAAAQEAIRAGNKRQARTLLQEAVKHDPQNHRAWLWLAGLAASPEASLEYARRAERLSPNDPTVQKAVAWAERRVARQKQSTVERQTIGPGASATTPPLEASATRTEATSSQRVDALRERTRADSGENAAQPPSKWRRRSLIAIVVILAIVAAAALAWPTIGDLWATGGLGLASNALPGEPAASPTPTLASTNEVALPAQDLAAVNFVAGQFAPQSAAVPPAEDEEPTDEADATATPLPLSIQPKPVSRNDNNPRPTWTLTPSPTFTPTATPTPVPTFVSEDRVVGGAQRPAGVGPNERWIDVNLTTQRLVAYEGDSAVFDTLVSSGTWQFPTVTGQFRVWLRYVAQTMDGRRLGYDYYLPNVPYVMYFYRDYALHGTYWHNNFGTPMSHGCVNLPTPAAEWIFNWSSIGTLVNVHH